MGNVIISLPFLKTPMVNSLPWIISSTKTWSSSLNAFAIAASNCAGSATLLIPILEPPLLGFTNTGNCKDDATSLAAIGFDLNKCFERATEIPPIPATATVYLLLNVIADVAASQPV